MEQRIEIERLEQAVNIFGSFDENIRLIEAEFQVTVTNREGELRISGEPEDTMLAAKAIQALLDVDKLKASKDQTADIKAALEKLKADSGYLFDTGETPPPYAAGTGTGGGRPVTGLDAIRAAAGLTAGEKK